ncbi:RecQ family ATP-dependent DNA helicase [Lacticigenium naphthae]|uniref:RecQ family ATP-dependent DNA helicase n=1 Tax=Lacticigenium naphthae TaxID=515351 RepID=UPI0004292626|nr:RecQ family ATP-dependent DNA helicase [Lacticigenium naphthae]
MDTNELTNLLSEKFQFASFRLGQEEAIQETLKGNDTLVLLPTGSGKSVCYQMAGYALGGLTVIVSPLLSLMHDQVEKMKQQGEKRVVALNSMLTYQEKTAILKRLSAYQFIFISPEMLLQENVLRKFRQENISLFVIDEAHCISQWGIDFRPEYLSLGTVRSKLGFPTTMALTATATEAIQQDIKTVLGMKKETTSEIVYSMDRPEIELMTEICQRDKDERIINYVNYLQKPGIIYFSSKKMAQSVSKMLKDKTDLAVEVYHADVPSEDKVKIQQQFLDDELQVICATSAFGMGVDKQNIRFVIHYHLPANPESYLQEIGRCARDGKASLAILLYEPGDERIPLYLQADNFPSKEIIHQIYMERKIPHALIENVQAQVGWYYFSNHFTLEEAYDRVDQYSETKQQQLQFMLDFIRTADCKRKTLLAYFDETIKSNSNGCCSSCNEQLIAHFKETKMVKSKATVNENWQFVMKKLLKL